MKEFSDRLLKVVNQIRVLGEELTDQRIVEKVLVSLPEKFESKISSLEESRNLNEISLAELINALQATEQRRQIRKEESLENAFLSRQRNRFQQQRMPRQNMPRPMTNTPRREPNKAQPRRNF